VVVADAGMLSAENFDAIEDAHLSFIVGPRISKVPYDLAAHLERHGNAFDDGQVLESARRNGRCRTGAGPGPRGAGLRLRHTEGRIVPERGGTDLLRGSAARLLQAAPHGAFRRRPTRDRDGKIMRRALIKQFDA